MLIKAGSIQNLTDARYFSSRNAEWIGFCFDPASPHFINPREVQQIMNWLQGPNFIGEFGNQSVKEIRETAMILNLSAVEIAAEFIDEAYNAIQVPVGIKVSLYASTDYDAVKNVIKLFHVQLEYLLIDTTSNFVDWNEFLQHSKLGIDGLSKLTEDYPVMLSAKFDRENIASIISVIDLYAIQLNGSAEKQTGEKAFDELEELMELL